MPTKSRRVALSCFLLLPLAAYAQQVPVLPDALETYYQTRNLTAAISTPSERASLASDTRDLPLTERLGRVRAMLESIAAQELSPDPGMIQGVNLYPFVPSSIIEVTDVRELQNGTLEVETLVRHLSQESNLQFIRSYESNKKSTGRIYSTSHP